MLDHNGNFVQIKSYQNELENQVEDIMSCSLQHNSGLTSEQSFRVEALKWQCISVGEMMTKYCPDSEELKSALILLGSSFMAAIEAIRNNERNSEKDH